MIRSGPFEGLGMETPGPEGAGIELPPGTSGVPEVEEAPAQGLEVEAGGGLRAPAPPAPAPPRAPSPLPVSLPGAEGGTFVDPGSAAAQPYQTAAYGENRFVGGAPPPGRGFGPGGAVSGGGMGLLGDDDMELMRSVMGRNRQR